MRAALREICNYIIMADPVLDNFFGFTGLGLGLRLGLD